MTVQLRPFSRSDNRAAQTLLNTAWPDSEGSAKGLTWVLESGGALLGVGRVLPINTIHPFARTLDVTLGEACPIDAAAQLYQHLMDSHPAQMFWRATCLERHRAAREGLAALGFAEVRCTWTPQVPLSAFPDDWLLGEFQQAKRLGYTISEEAVWGEVFKAELTRAHLHQYRQTHGINPPANLPFEDWQDIFLDDLDSLFTVYLLPGAAANWPRLPACEVAAKSTGLARSLSLPTTR